MRDHGDGSVPHHHHPARLQTEEAVLDIGGDIGALILYTDPEDRGREIEVSPIAADGEVAGPRTHTAIHERLVGARTVFAGLYPQLRAGTYRLWADRAGAVDTVTIVGGQVSEVDWRTGSETAQTAGTAEPDAEAPGSEVRAIERGGA